MNSPIKYILTALFILFFHLTAAITQTLQWTQTYGGSGDDGGEAIIQSYDGGLVIAGFKSIAAYGYKDVILIKTNAAGSEAWTRIFNLHLNDIARGLRQTSDGGYIITGMTEVTPQIFDPFLIKTDSLGNIQWQQQYDNGFGFDDRGHDVWQTSDGGYIMAGQTWMMHGAFGNYDMYIVKTDANGTIQWKKIFFRENEGGDVALGIQQLNNGDYIIGGFTQSTSWASYIIRTDNLGNSIWSNIYPGAWQSECYDIQSTSDGGFIFTGTESSYETDTDVLLTKLNSNGTLVWKKIYGTVDADQGNHLKQLSDGGYIIAGQSAHSGSYDVYVVRTNSTGDELWTSTIGGSSDDRGLGVTTAPGGGFAVSGWAWSYGQGMGDIYLMKLTESVTGNETENEPVSFKLFQNYPNPFNPSTTIKYSVTKQSRVNLTIYNSLGKEIAVLNNGVQNPGIYETEWNASGNPSGIYFYTLTVEGSVIDTKRMILIK